MLPRKFQYNTGNQKGGRLAELSMLFLSLEDESGLPEVTGAVRLQP